MIKPTILVTGGAGYVGSHVCIALSDAGFVPVSFDDLRSGHRELVRWGPFEFGSLQDGGRLSEVIAEHRPLACVHLAGSSSLAESGSQATMYWQNNVLGSEVLIECLSGIEHLNLLDPMGNVRAEAPEIIMNDIIV